LWPHLGSASSENPPRPARTARSVEYPGMNYAVYSNVGSRPGQDSEEQLGQLRRVALAAHREVSLFVDRGSAGPSDRPQLQKLFRAAARGDFQVVLVWALDRFVGETVVEAFLLVQQLLRYHNVQFHSYTEPHFRIAGGAGTFLLQTADWIAQQDHIRLSERTKAGLATARAQGKRLGRPPKMFPRDLVAADRARGLTWRQLAQLHQVPHSTLRKALHNLTDVDLRQLDDAGHAAPASAPGPSQ
jgi:DNA invertase Pin-like site-specific DNA recombinase